MRNSSKPLASNSPVNPGVEWAKVRQIRLTRRLAVAQRRAAFADNGAPEL